MTVRLAATVVMFACLSWSWFRDVRPMPAKLLALSKPRVSGLSRKWTKASTRGQIARVTPPEMDIREMSALR